MYRNNFLVHVKCNKKILKEDGDGNITIPFDSHYSIVMKNMDSRRCVVSITIDGKLIGNDLILDGNQLVTLKRFIDDINSGNKFRFVKKESENTKSSDIDKGFIRVEVKWEKSNSQFYDNRPIAISRLVTDKPYHGENIGYSDDISCCLPGPIVTKSRSLGPDDSTVYAKIPEPSERVFHNPNVVSFDNKESNSKLEEGITVKGKKCNQKFKFGEIGELESCSTVFVFKLMGYKKSTQEEIKEFYRTF